MDFYISIPSHSHAVNSHFFPFSCPIWSLIPKYMQNIYNLFIYFLSSNVNKLTNQPTNKNVANRS